VLWTSLYSGFISPFKENAYGLMRKPVFLYIYPEQNRNKKEELIPAESCSGKIFLPADCRRVG
jgi:hypothetical protein